MTDTGKLLYMVGAVMISVSAGTMTETAIGFMSLGIFLVIGGAALFRK